MPAFHVRLNFFFVLLLTKRKLQISIIPFENARVFVFVLLLNKKKTADIDNAL